MGTQYAEIQKFIGGSGRQIFMTSSKLWLEKTVVSENKARVKFMISRVM